MPGIVSGYLGAAGRDDVAAVNFKIAACGMTPIAVDRIGMGRIRRSGRKSGADISPQKDACLFPIFR
jgi:hypothetical protein